MRPPPLFPPNPATPLLKQNRVSQNQNTSFEATLSAHVSQYKEERERESTAREEQFNGWSAKAGSQAAGAAAVRNLLGSLPTVSMLLPPNISESPTNRDGVRWRADTASLSLC